MTSIDIWRRVDAELRINNSRNLGALVEELGSRIRVLTTSESIENIKLSPSQHVNIPMEILQTYRFVMKQEDYINALRLYRGVILYLRNISPFVFIDREDVLRNLIIFWTTDHKSQGANTDLGYRKTLSSYFELLSNVSLRSPIRMGCSKLEIAFLELCSQNQVWDEFDLMAPFSMIMQQWTHDEEVVDSLVSSPQLRSLTQGMADFIIKSYIRDQLSASDERLIQALARMFTSVKFFNFILDLRATNDSAALTSILKACQLVLTSDMIELGIGGTSFPTWLVEMLSILRSDTIDVLNTPRIEEELKNCNLQTVAVLDILSHRAQIGSGLPQDLKISLVVCLGELLKLVHEGTIAEGFKKQVDSKTQRVIYPWVKSLIIENLGNLCCENPDVQNLLREEHILELVLSNCIIDRSNPYMKERAILCIKYALEKNHLNQNLVAQLEATQVIDESALHQAGLKAKIENGRVKIMKSV